MLLLRIYDDLTIEAVDSQACLKFLVKYLLGLFGFLFLNVLYTLLYIAVAMKSFLHSFQSSSHKHTVSSSRAPDAPLLNMNALTVIELFQSQGCSSCPPTSSNILKLADDPNMLILTYHVTYWDRLGWKDTFGNSAFDQRQWDYAKALERKNVFTPQVRHTV